MVKDKIGVPLYCIITLRDIDKLKDAESRLNQSQAIAEPIFTTSSDAIITADTKGVFLSVNKAASRMFGYDHDDLVGKSLKILMPYPYTVNHDKYIRDYLRTGKSKIINKGRETQGLKKTALHFRSNLL